MKAQKLGLVLGINMVAACLMMQGCADPKSPKGQKLAASRNATAIASPSSTDQTITIISRPGPASRPMPVAVAPIAEPQAAQPILQEPVITATTTPAPVPVVQKPLPPPPPPAPSSVRTVKKLPTAPAKAPKAKPAAATVKAPAIPAGSSSNGYVVKPGDTLFLISKRTNYRQSAIIAANPGLNPNRLRVGQKLNMPGAVAAPAQDVAKAASAAKEGAKDEAGKDKVKLAAAAAPAAAAADTKPPVKTRTGFVPYEGPTKDYVVQSGESLGSIAGKFGISIRALKALNGLKNDALRAGQKLKVPAEKQTAAKPEAAAKDAAKDVPAKPADDAQAAPVPAAAPAPVAADATKPAEPVNDKEPEKKPEEAAKPEVPVNAEVKVPSAEEVPVALTHTVKAGEDLVSIAIAYGVSPSALMDINDLKPSDEVKPGQVLRLPANARPNVQ